MAAEPEAADLEVIDSQAGEREAEARAEEERLRARAEQMKRKADRAQQELEGMTDWELIGDAPGLPHVSNPLEMNRRLKDSIKGLTVELTRFRQSSDALARRLVWLTWLLVVLTAILVGLTITLIVGG